MSLEPYGRQACGKTQYSCTPPTTGEDLYRAATIGRYEAIKQPYGKVVFVEWVLYTANGFSAALVGYTR